MTLKLLLMGTGEFAVPAFAALADGPHQVVGLVTLPGGSSAVSDHVDLHPLCQQHGIATIDTTDINSSLTIKAIERELVHDGLVARYSTDGTDDGVGGREGAFLACSFWLADAYVLAGRHEDARALYDRLLGLRNDLGLLAEEYDVVAGRLLGNFPQAFSHIGLINTAHNLMAASGPARQRADQLAPKRSVKL